MSGSRLTWAGSTVAPWALAFGLLVSITAQAGQDPAAGISFAARSGSGRGVVATAAFSAPSDGAPVLIKARLALGSPAELATVPDEIEPNPALKSKKAALPAINRERKGDPFIPLRPGLDARAHARAPAPEADFPAESATPASASDHAAATVKPTLVFGDGATPSIPMELALVSASPTSSDGLLRAGAAKPAQTTIVSQGLSTARPNYAALIDPKDNARQMRCLAEAVYFESRSEPEAGQAAVAQVVLNRVRSGIFPTDVCGVVYQDRNRPFACQFSFACEGKSLRIEEPGAWAVATRIAQEVVSGVNYNARVAEALNYHATYVYPFWAPSLRRVDKIGMHVFYAMKFGLNWAPGALNGRGDLPPLQAQAASVVPVGVAR